MKIEDNWTVECIKQNLQLYNSCEVEIDLLYCEHIHKPELIELCTKNYWYIDPLSDGYRTFIIHKDYLKQDSQTRKICGYTAQQAVENKIDRRVEAIYKPMIATDRIDEPARCCDPPEIRTYRIQWLSRPLHRIYDQKQEYIPIWHLI